jgi:hypothetical protein
VVRDLVEGASLLVLGASMSFSDVALRLMTAGLVHVVDGRGVLRSYTIEGYCQLNAAALRNTRVFLDIVEARRFAGRSEEKTDPLLCKACGTHVKLGERCETCFPCPF